MSYEFDHTRMHARRFVDLAGGEDPLARELGRRGSDRSVWWRCAGRWVGFSAETMQKNCHIFIRKAAEEIQVKTCATRMASARSSTLPARISRNDERFWPSSLPT